MTNEEILEKQVEALEKLLQIKQAIIEELEAKVLSFKEVIIAKDQELEKQKSQINELVNECITIGKEKERIEEEKVMVDKRNKIEEDSLKKRIKLHEEFAKE